MDIQRQVSPPPWWRTYWYIAPLLAITALVVWGKRYFGDASYIVNREEVQTARVERGEFRVDVRGAGVLKPQDIRWVSSQVAGRVEQMMIKVGATVTRGQALVQLSNPELHRALERAKWELEATRAENHAAYVAMESQLVDLENSVTEAEYNYKSTKLRLDAETELLSQGKGSVSMLDYQRTQLSVEQQLQRWRAQQQRAEKMRANLDASKVAHAARLGLVENSYQRASNQVADLTVRATTDGVVQQLSLELGQQAAVGGSVALIADPRSLMAELQIQELQIRDIALGQPVVVDTRSSELRGEVVRIDPAVVNGVIQVDVKLLDALPAEARPDLNVEGLIETSRIEDALFVRRPAFAPRFSDAALYRLAGDSPHARRQQVRTGQSSVQHIQILAGLDAGDTIVISDTSAWQEHAEVLIN